MVEPTEEPLSPYVVREQDIITEFLKMYQTSTCLWDVTSAFYFNKQSRNEAYEKLLTVWKKMQPAAKVNTVKKKLEHFRASYRRERKKIESNLMGHPNAAYKPSLWYYDLMTFLNRRTYQEEPSNEDVSIKTTQATETPKKKRKVSSSSQPEETLYVIYNDKTGQQDMQQYQAKWDGPEYLKAYGQAIAGQLKELDDHVRYEAERIIADVIHRARTGTLEAYSSQLTPGSIQTSESFGIPKAEPSWYDLPADTADDQITFDDGFKTES